MPSINGENIKNGVLEHHLKSWKEFTDLIADPSFSWSTLIYRGQANANWKVESTLDRLEERFQRTPNIGGHIPAFFAHPPVAREVHLRRFQDMVRGRFGPNPPPEDDKNEWWALAQHHGLATPMLDWTYYPFVGLFFAFEEEKCNCSGKWSEPERRAVFALASHLVDENAGDDEEGARPFSPKGHANYRLTNQGGLFLKMPKGKELESYVKEHFVNDTYSDEPGRNRPPRAILQKIIIPNEGRRDCLWFLNKMNINRASLFPDLDGAARYVNNLWEIDFDSSIGYIPRDLK